MSIQTIKLTLPLLLAGSLAAAPSALADRSPIMKALLHNDGEGFTPPADNRPLQALLAQHPALTFLEACGVGDTAEIARQLKRDPKLATTSTEFGASALHLAAFSGVPGAVQLLLERGAEINARARNKFKNTPLQVALLAGQFATAKLLLERGADPLVRQAGGFTPLQEAALLGRRDLVDLFLGAGAEINSRSDDGRTAVTEALRGKHPELADYLRSKGGHGAEITADLMAPPKE
jgi:ankyrin repeat protein